MFMPRLSAMFLIIFHLLFEVCSSQVLEEPVFVRASALVPRIVNGTPAELGDVPYQVGFKQSKGRVYKTFCGGTIIGPAKLVSAAHCFTYKGSSCCKTDVIQEGKEINKYYAVAGTLLNEERYPKKGDKSVAQWRRVSKVIYPSTFDFPKDDICVVMVQSSFNFNDHVSPVSYASSKYEDYRGECLVSGYGRITKKGIRSEILLLAVVEVLPNYYCNKLHNRNMKKFICTSAKIADISKGDSGGPLVCQNTRAGKRSVLVGVVSGKRFKKRRIEGRTIKGGSFFTRVSAYSDYVTKNETKDHKSMYLYYYCIVAFKRRKSGSKRRYSTFCGGAIIGDKKIITAAHCFNVDKSICCGDIVLEGNEVSEKFAVAATLLNVERYDPNSKSKRTAQWRRLSKVFYPGSFKFPKDDIAIVVVQEKFTFNKNVAWIPYATRYRDYRGECLMSGYGRMEEGDVCIVIIWVKIKKPAKCESDSRTEGSVQTCM
ncbi:hypothetical protein ABMA27_002538 [Loxostege sticticalis]|uniref:Peptidase S1 domain-containing protein n=1 Tax=Loxostege sticticalis TaxID=481309 RepID=A0ABR3HU21_LOXSC